MPGPRAQDWVNKSNRAGLWLVMQAIGAKQLGAHKPRFHIPRHVEVSGMRIGLMMIKSAKTSVNREGRFKMRADGAGSAHSAQ